MSITSYFYNATTKKYIAVFGTIFNKLSVARNNLENEEVQRIIVPISYGPYQKFLARIQQDPNLDRKTAITLPRMSFEILGMSYDGTRKVGVLKKILSPTEGNFQYAPAPYNIEFNLSIMTKYAEDGTQLLEQIIPFFKPEMTTTVKILDNIDPIDIPLVLNSISMEDLYEGDFITRRSLLWTLNFTMKAYYFGPVKERKVIKFIDTRYYTTGFNTDNVPEIVDQIYPGLTANGEPTTDPNLTIPYTDILKDDDWGVIIVSENYDSEVHE